MGKINPIVGVYIPIKRIPFKGGMTIPNIGSLDPGTYEKNGFRCTISFGGIEFQPESAICRFLIWKGSEYER